MAAVLCAVAILIGPAAGVSAAQPEDDGLRFESSATYRLDPAARAVHVSMDITVTNQVPDEGNMYTYFTEVWVPMLAEATNVLARERRGSKLRTTVKKTDNPYWSEVRIRLPRQLRYRRTQVIRLTYDLPDLPPRSTGWTRANPAHAFFEAHAVGDSGLADVEVIVPSSYEVETTGSELISEEVDGATVFRATDIADPAEWWASFAARNDALLDERTVDVGGHQVVIRSRPGDKAWADFVADYATRGIPVLEKLIGQPWPVDGRLEIVEASTPHLYGYAGWYDSKTKVIEVGDELDPELILHELSHAWFNSDISSEMWLAEGLAEEYAASAVAELGGKAKTPAAVSASAPGAQPLSAWRRDNHIGTDSDDANDYGYGASAWLLDQLSTEIGQDGMADMLQAIVAHELAYVGDPKPERWTGETDWRRILDVFEERGGSAKATGLFSKLVIAPGERASLDARAAARTEYAQLQEAGAGWTPPLEVRKAMSGWSFERSESLVESALQVLASRDAALADLRGLGITALPGLEASYEIADDANVVLAQAERYTETAVLLGEAVEPRDGIDGVVETFGLLGSDVDGRAADAAQMLADGDVDTAEEMARDLSDRADWALIIGVSRYLMLTVLFLGVALIWRRRFAGDGLIS